MKKVLVSILLLVILLGALATNAMATTNAELIEFAKSNHTVSGKSIGLTDANKVKVERYLTENPVTDAQAGQIMAKAKELIALMESAGVSDPANLSKADKDRFIAIAQEGADVIGVKLVFHAHSVDVYKDGKLIESASLGNKLAYTGNNINLALVISSLAIIALATTAFVAKKRFANA
ncbi:MAG: hypothetical protein IKF17_05255 [Clostridia bacterium]|nr:hypothetical protein [Clostridia bacterium]